MRYPITLNKALLAAAVGCFLIGLLLVTVISASNPHEQAWLFGGLLALALGLLL